MTMKTHEEWSRTELREGLLTPKKLFQMRGPKLTNSEYSEQGLNSRNMLEFEIMGIHVLLNEGDEE